MGVDGDPYYLIPEGCAMRVSKTFYIPKKPNTCLSVENEYLHSYTTDRAPIAYMFSGYLLYQRYFNGLLFSERVCNDAALREFKRALVLYPNYSALSDLLKNLKQIPLYTKCLGDTKEVSLTDVLEKEKESEQKKDMRNAIYYQSQASIIEPANVSVRMKLADLYIRIGAYDNALIEYNDVLTIQPHNQEAYQNYYKVKEAIELGVELSP